MPIITDISAQKNNKERVNLYIDGSFFCGLNYITAIDFKLKIGGEVDCDELTKMLFESEKKSAYDKAINYVMHGLKTQKQVTEYLKRKGYTTDVISFVVEYLQQIKYINDAEYAKIYVEESRLKGKALLRKELFERGICRSDIEDAVEIIDDESQACTDVAEKYMRGKNMDKKMQQKLIFYLRNKGFSFETIKAVIQELYGI